MGRPSFAKEDRVAKSGTSEGELNPVQVAIENDSSPVSFSIAKNQLKQTYSLDCTVFLL